MSGSQRCAYLVDASIYIFRAYYSVPDSLTNSDDEPINALHGFAGFLGGLLDGLERVAGMKLRGAARVQRLLEEHRDVALLARRLTCIATDPDLKAGMQDVQRRKVNAADVTRACEQLGLGGMTTARLTRTLL